MHAANQRAKIRTDICRHVNGSRRNFTLRQESFDYGRGCVDMNLHIREQSRRSSDLHVCTPVGPNQEQKFEPGVCLQMDVSHP